MDQFEAICFSLIIAKVLFYGMLKDLVIKPVLIRLHRSQGTAKFGSRMATGTR